MCECLYLPNPSGTGWIRHEVILSGVLLVWIQCFSSRPVALHRLKKSVYPTILQG